LCILQFPQDIEQELYISSPGIGFIADRIAIMQACGTSIDVSAATHINVAGSAPKSLAENTTIDDAAIPAYIIDVPQFHQRNPRIQTTPVTAGRLNSSKPQVPNTNLVKTNITGPITTPSPMAINHLRLRTSLPLLCCGNDGNAKLDYSIGRNFPQLLPSGHAAQPQRQQHRDPNRNPRKHRYDRSRNPVGDVAANSHQNCIDDDRNRYDDVVLPT
jgi:hypothetical protein